MTTLGPYAQVGAKLVELGYSAIPIMPGTKRPGELRRGEWVGISDWRAKYTERKPTNWEIQVWSQSAAGVGVLCGPASGGLVGVDIDTDDPAIVAALMAVLPPTTVKKRGAKGETLFYRGPDIDRSPSWNVGGRRVCDLIGPGRQTLLPPTIHPDTNEPYRWTAPDTLEDTSPADLPELTPAHVEAIGAALAPFGWEPERDHLAPTVPSDHDEDHPFSEVNRWALDNLDEWVPRLNLYRAQRTRDGWRAVPTWRPSNSGNAPEQRKLSLSVSRFGITDFGSGDGIGKGYSAIQLYAAAAPCSEDDAFVMLAQAMGWCGYLEPKEAPPIAPGSPPVSVPAEAATTAPGAQQTRPRGTGGPDTDPRDAELERLSWCEGVVGQIVDWITDTQPTSPDRILALGSAVCLVGTLIGRRAATPTRSATHLYAATLATTGAGKSHAADCTRDLLMASGAGGHLGPKSFMSQSAIINFILRTPLCLCVQDEFSNFLDQINSKRASSFQSNIAQEFKELWSASFKTYVTPEWAQRSFETVRSPAMSISAYSTPEAFYEALSGKQIADGFLNRFLILHTDRELPDEEPVADVGRVPSALAASLRRLYYWSHGELGTTSLNSVDLDSEPDRRGWANDAAKAVYQDYKAHISARRAKDTDVAPFLARAAEMAIRLATIRAAGMQFHQCRIDADDVQWGIDLTNASLNRLIEEADFNMVDDASSGQLRNKILKHLRKHAGAPVQHSKLTKALSRPIAGKKREFEDTLKQLEEGEYITKTVMKPAKGGKPTTYYELVGA